MPLEDPLEVKTRKNVDGVWFQETQRMAMGVHECECWMGEKIPRRGLLEQLPKLNFTFQPSKILGPLVERMPVEDIELLIYEYLFDDEKIKRLYEMEVIELNQPERTVFIFC